MLQRPRSSKIYYDGKFFTYPLKPFEALMKLGIVRSTLCVLSWFKARLFPVRHPRNFEEWVGNQFGKRLFNIFFKSYTEKVWGMSCKEISADWAAQRIRGLSLGSAIKNALFPQRPPNGDRAKVIKTLINSFRCPRKGPGLMWEAAAAKVTAMGGKIEMSSRVGGCTYDSTTETWTVQFVDGNGNQQSIDAEHVISSAPMRELVCGIVPAVSDRTRRAAESLKYRDFLTVMLILKERNKFADNWIYIHDPRVKVGRVQNFKSWSPEMVPDPTMACYGLEYFCFEGDGLWESKEEDLIALAKRELIEGLNGRESTAVLNADDARVAAFGAFAPGRVLTYGVAKPAFFMAREIEDRGALGSSFEYQSPEGRVRLELTVPGRHAISNALAALAAASVWGIGAAEAQSVFRSLRAPAMRGELLRFTNGAALINDSYNSSPAALQAMTELLGATPNFRRRILAAGEMRELGAASAELHREAGQFAAKMGKIDWIIGVAGDAAQIVEGAVAASHPRAQTKFFASPQEAAEFLGTFMIPGDLLLVKGSRGVKMEQIVESLIARHAAPGEFSAQQVRH